MYIHVCIYIFIYVYTFIWPDLARLWLGAQCAGFVRIFRKGFEAQALQGLGLGVLGFRV